MSLDHRTGSSKAGPQTARLVECKRSKYHGFHPENELCPVCAPPCEEALEYVPWEAPPGFLNWF
jgi:hypothetical protein